VSDVAHEAGGYATVEQESPELLARGLRVGAQLWASATVFFFFAFLFAFFYLRELNNHGLWRPKHVDPSITLGTLVTIAVVAAAALVRLGLADHRAGRRDRWRIEGAAALAALLAAVGLQVAEWWTQGFGPTDGAYASVYLGWTGLFLLFLIGLAVFTTSSLFAGLAGGAAARAAGAAHEGSHGLAGQQDSHAERADPTAD